MSSSRLFEEYNHTVLYKRYRRDYPNELIEYVIAYLKEKHRGPYNLAVDVGCGNGQATKQFSKFFDWVYGFDVSENQIKQATDLEQAHPNLKFFTSPSESLELDDSSVDLVFVATAIHWFNIDDFFKECKRILKPNGVLAVWSYFLEKFKCNNESIAIELNRLYGEFFDFVEPSPNLDHLRTRYNNIQPPFQDLIRNYSFRMKAYRSVDDLINNIRTWSAYQTYKARHPQTNCLEEFKIKFEEILNGSEFEAELELFLVIGRN
jgi:ubiquinone/menaquinone biosynthesis C-methylase UbiE